MLETMMILDALVRQAREFSDRADDPDLRSDNFGIDRCERMVALCGEMEGLLPRISSALKSLGSEASARAERLKGGIR